MSFHNGEAFLKTLEPELFWPIEFEGIDAFRWTPPRFDIQVPPGWRFATVRFCSPKRGNSLRLIAGGNVTEFQLLEGWQRIDLETFGEPRVICEVGNRIDEPDRGNVGLMLGEILFHDDAERHRKISGRHRECLSAEELVALAPKLRLLGREVDIPTVVEWDDFLRNVGPRQAGEPLCSEPWKTAYLLNRGIMPCCYGREPMVSWSEVDQSNLEAGITQAINSAPFRQLRRDLREGRLGAYCERAQGCPVVKARRHASS